MAYRSRSWGWRWWLQRFYAKGGMPFDDAMRPLVAGKEGVEALRDYIALTRYMPKDILGWATPQAYPFYAAGHAFSIMTYPSIALAAEHPEKSTVRGKNAYCLVPGYIVNGKLVRRSIQGFGNIFYVSSYGKHAEAAYWLIQWLTSKEVSARLVTHTDSVFDKADTNTARDVYIHDRSTGTTTLVSMGGGGEVGNAGSFSPAYEILCHAQTELYTRMFRS